ncbi:MAG: hypothetical protein HQK51_05240 [Oligoflexia bacterium]|nr:hypothetical protein [Oligoflexia bacterium]
MFRLLITITLISIIFLNQSCLKKQDESPSSSEFLNAQKMKIIAAINSKDSDQALKLISELNEEQQLDNEIKYLKAEVYAIKANIDVYSLFPIIKLKLFEFALTEWNDIRKYSEKQRAGLGDIVGANLTDERLDQLSEEMERIKKLPPGEVTFTVADVKYHLYANRYCDLTFRYNSPLFIEEDYSWSYYEAIVNSEEECKEKASKLPHIITKEPGSLYFAQERVKYNAIDLINNKITKTYKRRSQEQYIQIIWAVYDSMPIINSSPLLSSENRNFVLDSLKLLKEVKTQLPNEDRIGKDARQHMILLSGFIIIEAIKSSIDFNKVEKPSDIICNIIPINVVANYPQSILAARYLLEISQETGFLSLKQELFDRLIPLVKNAPNELSAEEKKETMDELSKIKSEFGC